MTAAEATAALRTAQAAGYFEDCLTKYPDRGWDEDIAALVGPEFNVYFLDRHSSRRPRGDFDHFWLNGDHYIIEVRQVSVSARDVVRAIDALARARHFDRPAYFSDFSWQAYVQGKLDDLLEGSPWRAQPARLNGGTAFCLRDDNTGSDLWFTLVCREANLIPRVEVTCDV